MAAMASKFNFECVIQYYTDQWVKVHWRDFTVKRYELFIFL